MYTKNKMRKILFLNKTVTSVRLFIAAAVFGRDPKFYREDASEYPEFACYLRCHLRVTRSSFGLRKFPGSLPHRNF